MAENKVYKKTDYVVQPSKGYMHYLLVITLLFFMLIYTLILLSSVLGARLGAVGFVRLEFILFMILLLFHGGISWLLYKTAQEDIYRLGDGSLTVTTGTFSKKTQSYELINVVSCTTRQKSAGKMFNFGEVDVRIRFIDSPVILEGVEDPATFAKELHARLRNVTNPPG